jgi:iron complex outermembrane receptor protein
MDLAQVEVIKGAASALYGSSALGGVINLLSKQPPASGTGGTREILLNGTSLGGGDAVVFATGRLSGDWGYSLLGSAHRQGRIDQDEDGWTDVPGYNRVVARPRLFWNNVRGETLYLTAGATLEERAGGTLPGRSAPDGSTYDEALTTERFDIGSVGSFTLTRAWLLTARASAMSQRHGHTFGTQQEDDRHTTGFAEAALSRATSEGVTVVGLALQSDWYRNRDLPSFDFTHVVPGVFLHAEWTPERAITVAGSARLDRHSAYGTFLNPRVSALIKPGGAWNVRGSAGTGFYAPTPLNEETEVIGLSRLAPNFDIDAEKARSASLDLGGVLGAFEVNATVFGSVIDRAVQVRTSQTESGRIDLVNAEGPTRTYGTELLARYRREPWHVTGSYTYTRSSESDPESPGSRREVALTPRHSLGVVGMWEAEGITRIGIEMYVTGRQALEDNPFRTTSEPYVVLGLLAERRIGPARIFINFENITGIRQTNYDPLVLPARASDGRWTTDAWAPLEGRVVNGGMRLGF